MKTPQRHTRHPRGQPTLSQQLMQAWVEAAQKWRQLRSDPAMAACVTARAAYYRATSGYVPPVCGDGIPDDAGQVSVLEDAPPEEATPPLDIGMVVRLTEKARTLPAFQSIPADWFGVITGSHATSTGLRRFLVDPDPVGGGWGRMADLCSNCVGAPAAAREVASFPTGGWGRHLVREEHLEPAVKPKPRAERTSELITGVEFDVDPLTVRCSQCGAEPGQPCISPRGITHARRVDTARHRTKRLAAAAGKTSEVIA